MMVSNSGTPAPANAELVALLSLCETRNPHSAALFPDHPTERRAKTERQMISGERDLSSFSDFLPFAALYSVAAEKFLVTQLDHQRNILVLQCCFCAS